MDKSSKLKAVAIAVCCGIAGSAIAAGTANHMNGNNNNQDQLVGQAAKPNDAALTKDVSSALSSEHADKVKASVKGGVVYLTGELPSDTDYEQVITAAESVKGVEDVNVDSLTVKESKNPLYDTYITGKVKGSLIQSDIMGKDVPAWTISVETKNGQVFLSGTVANQQEKQNVLKIARSVKGVKKVDDQMQLSSQSDTQNNNAVDQNNTNSSY